MYQYVYEIIATLINLFTLAILKSINLSKNMPLVKSNLITQQETRGVQNKRYWLLFTQTFHTCTWCNKSGQSVRELLSYRA